MLVRSALAPRSAAAVTEVALALSAAAHALLMDDDDFALVAAGALDDAALDGIADVAAAVAVAVDSAEDELNSPPIILRRRPPATRPPAALDVPLLIIPNMLPSALESDFSVELESAAKSSGVSAGTAHLQVEYFGPSTVPLHRRQCNLAMGAGAAAAAEDDDDDPAAPL